MTDDGFRPTAMVNTPRIPKLDSGLSFKLKEYFAIGCSRKRKLRTEYERLHSYLRTRPDELGRIRSRPSRLRGRRRYAGRSGIVDPGRDPVVLGNVGARW